MQHFAVLNRIINRTAFKESMLLIPRRVSRKFINKCAEEKIPMSYRVEDIGILIFGL